MPRYPVRTELIGSDLIWCLSLTYAGRVYRWASRPVEATDDAGDTYTFEGGLDAVDLTERFSGQNGDPDQLSIPFEVWFPRDTNIATLVAAGHDLGAATGEVAQWVEGTSWDNRRVILTGSVVEPEYGGPDEPVSFSVEQNPWDDTALIPGATARVTTSTWPSAPNDSQGLYYPVIFGRPGQWGDSILDITPGSPAIPVKVTGSEVDTLLIAGHEVAASTVFIFYDDSYSFIIGNVLHTTDGRGRKVATVDISGESTTVRQATHWVGWRNISGGGLWDETRSNTMTGAGDICEWVLRQSSLPVDRGRWAAARGYLNRFKIDGYLDDAVSPWEWLTDNVLPLLPLDVRAGPDGLYPVVWRFDAVATDAVEHLEVGPGIVRSSPVSYSRLADVVNSIRLDYSLIAGKNQYWQTRVDTDVSSKARYGVREKSIETDVVYDDATATMITSWMIQALSLPSRSVSYEVGQTYAWLQPGDVLTLTDAELALTSQVCLLQGVRWLAEDALELELLMLEQPARDRRASV